MTAELKPIYPDLKVINGLVGLNDEPLVGQKEALEATTNGTIRLRIIYGNAGEAKKSVVTEMMVFNQRFNQDHSDLLNITHYSFNERIAQAREDMPEMHVPPLALEDQRKFSDWYLDDLYKRIAEMAPNETLLAEVSQGRNRLAMWTLAHFDNLKVIGIIPDPRIVERAIRARNIMTSRPLREAIKLLADEGIRLIFDDEEVVVDRFRKMAPQQMIESTRDSIINRSLTEVKTGELDISGIVLPISFDSLRDIEQRTKMKLRIAHMKLDLDQQGFTEANSEIWLNPFQEEVDYYVQLAV